MKDFMMRHPIISLLMLSEVCATVTHVFKHEENDSLLDREITAVCNSANAAIDKAREVKDRKDPIGFKTE